MFTSTAAFKFTTRFTAGVMVGLTSLAVMAGPAFAVDARAADVPAVEAAAVETVASVEELREATHAHLVEVGHNPNAEANAQAASLAQLGVENGLDFQGGVASVASDEGTANIYRLNAEEAEARLAWLKEESTNLASSPRSFGVAALESGGFIYLAEVFFSA